MIHGSDTQSPCWRPEHVAINAETHSNTLGWRTPQAAVSPAVILIEPPRPCDASPRFSLSQDDIIDDVGEFVAAAEILKERGAYKIYIMATHGLLSADAPRLIEESAIDEVQQHPIQLHTHQAGVFKSYEVLETNVSR